MSDAPAKIWTRCPICRSKYTVPFEALGHHARCKKCSTRFRVEEYISHPSEEDILRWLNEAPEENEFDHHPRVISGSQRQAKPTPTRVTRQDAVEVHHVGGQPN